MRYVSMTMRNWMISVALVLAPLAGTATTASYGVATIPALAPDGTIRFVERAYYCYNSTDHENAIPLILSTPIRWEAKDSYCRFADASYDEDGEPVRTGTTSADHRERNEVNPFRAAGLRFTVAGYRCPFAFRQRKRGIPKFRAAVRNAGLDDPRKLVALAIETLEKNLAHSRHVDCGIKYVGFDSDLVAKGALPKRFNRTVPDTCFSPNKKRGDASELVRVVRGARETGHLQESMQALVEALRTDCTNEDALLEQALVFARAHHVYGALAQLDRLHQLHPERAFREYRDRPELSAMRPMRWNRFYVRYKRWLGQQSVPR